ncbi:hypothetical protein H7100_00335 [Candidatus Saccharibacteria bacterium]|nr:hypothetical protein [Candidatus Saccharibacteria bacterium]
MSELQLYPLPTEKEYKDFLVSFDEYVIRNGGALQVVRDYEYLAVHHSRSHFDYLIAIGQVALVIEPKDSKQKRIDPLMLATHSLKRGMLLGLEMASTLYQDKVTPVEILSAVSVGFYHAEIDGHEADELEHMPLFEWGGRGLEMMGEASRRVIRLWSEDISNDTLNRKIFQYGVGIVAATSEALMMNEGMNAIEAHFNSTDWSQELEQILGSNTGE